MLRIVRGAYVGQICKLFSGRSGAATARGTEHRVHTHGGSDTTVWSSGPVWKVSPWPTQLLLRRRAVVEGRGRCWRRWRRCSAAGGGSPGRQPRQRRFRYRSCGWCCSSGRHGAASGDRAVHRQSQRVKRWMGAEQDWPARPFPAGLHSSRFCTGQWVRSGTGICGRPSVWSAGTTSWPRHGSGCSWSRRSSGCAGSTTAVGKHGVMGRRLGGTSLRGHGFLGSVFNSPTVSAAAEVDVRRLLGQARIPDWATCSIDQA